MIIVGWGHQRVKVVGPVEKIRCPRCEKEEFWEFVKISHYATFFFIPVVPYKREYIMRCPVCGCSQSVPDSQVDHRTEQAQRLLTQLRG